MLRLQFIYSSFTIALDVHIYDAPALVLRAETDVIVSLRPPCIDLLSGVRGIIESALERGELGAWAAREYANTFGGQGASRRMEFCWHFALAFQVAM